MLAFAMFMSLCVDVLVMSSAFRQFYCLSCWSVRCVYVEECW